jgi:EpsD family peptidyl-prolyl cis-trans isomerase
MSRPCGFVPLVALVASVALAAACGERDEKKVASQVAARVNSDEITVHQVNAILAGTRDASAPGGEAGVKREALERLVEQHLARQQAVLHKLDRSPQVVQAIEAARSQILARAYLEHVAAKPAPAPTPEEIRDYYARHSELFAQRRLYALDEISFAGREDLAVELTPRLAKARSLEEVADWLKSRQVVYTANRIGRPAEDIPLAMLDRLKSMKDGEMQLMDAGAGRVSVVRLVATKLAPVDEAAAAPRIERFIANQRAGQSIAEELKRLRAQANIAYFGEFAGAASQRSAAAPPQAAGGEGPSTTLDRAVRGLR